MATRAYRYLADSLTALKTRVFGAAAETPAISTTSLSQSTRRPRKSATTTSVDGSRVLSGRIPTKKAPARRPRPCRTVEDYKFRLDRLISGIDNFENDEELRNERRAQIAHRMLAENVNPDTDERISKWIEAEDNAETLIDNRFEILKTDANALVESLDPADNDPADRPPRLPYYLTSQLKAYEHANQIYETQQNTPFNNQDDLDIISGALSQARRQHQYRGWNRTQSSIQRLTQRKIGICKRRRITEYCRQRMIEEMRKLCKQSAPKTLKDEAFLELLRPPAREQQKYLEKQPVEDDDEAVEATDDLKREWAEAQKRLRDRRKDMTLLDPPGSLDKMLQTMQKRENEQGTQWDRAEFTAKYLNKHKQVTQRLHEAELKYREIRPKAIRAKLGNIPGIDYDSDVGEVDYHPDDNTQDSGMSACINEKQHQDTFPKVYDWRNNYLESAPYCDVGLPPSGASLWDEALSIGTLESNAFGHRFGPSAARIAKIANYREQCEAVRVLADLDYQRFA